MYFGRIKNIGRLTEGLLKMPWRLLLMEVTLTSLPQLIRPDVTFALASNLLRLESSLTRMIIECKYLAFRNQSDIVFDSGTKTNKHSPFSLQQIQFRGSLAKYQDNLFKTADKYVSDVVRNINSETVETGQAAMRMPTFRKYSKTICEEGPCANYMIIDNVTVHGLDSLYSSHTGGPFKLQTTKIAESLRFNSLTIRGTLRHENNTVVAEYDFVAEIQDLPVNFEINADKTDPTFEVLKWRSISFSIIQLEHYLRDPRAASAYVQGYLANELPILLKNHLDEMYKNSQHSKVTGLTEEPVCITEKKDSSS
ncbi:unnamed protein product [Danaus chrysippus]|uniref:(African queen) hypothetical protein n=1 Tax=Danaus chrysippus TaxID=151541 RepID=A0A8J2QMN8_9NEOP|nr:unnamed protein product [Danaus chrysippus]